MIPHDREIFDQIRAFYLNLPGRDEAGWEAVAADPRKFNRVWRVMLGEAPSGLPPEHILNLQDGDPNQSSLSSHQ